MTTETAVLHAPPLPTEALGRWLADRLPELSLPIHATLVAGGRSNLTYRLADAAGRALALRRPPVHVEVPGAHDVAREWRVISALHRHGRVRVPAPLAAGDDTGPIRVPFVVMDFVDGVVARDAASAARLDEPARRHVADALVDQLVELHSATPARLGLADLGRPDGYLERQLRRWSARVPDGSPAAALLRAGHARLASRIPPPQRAAVLHGDYRLDNVILSDAGEVLAVLDWELTTQGDPLADLGWLLLYWQPNEPLASALPGGSELPGFPAADHLAARYATGTGLDLADLSFYVAFAAWRLAVITLGVETRYRRGAGAGADVAVDRLGHDAVVLATHALTTLRG